MIFKLLEKTRNKIEKEKEANHFYAYVTKTKTEKICPMQIKLKNSSFVNVWNLEEKEILELITSFLNDFKQGLYNPEAEDELVKIIKCWTDKYKTISSSSIKLLKELKNEFSKYDDYASIFVFPLLKLEKTKVTSKSI